LSQSLGVLFEMLNEKLIMINKTFRTYHFTFNISLS
jgi:hypothetical protein